MYRIGECMDVKEDGVERRHTVQMVPETAMTHAESEGMVTQGSLKDTT